MVAWDTLDGTVLLIGVQEEETRDEAVDFLLPEQISSRASKVRKKERMESTEVQVKLVCL